MKHEEYIYIYIYTSTCLFFFREYKYNHVDDYMDEYHGPPKIKHLFAPVGYFLLNIPHCQSDKWVFVHYIIHETPGLSAWAECLTWLLCLGCCTFARLMTRTDTHTLT